MNVSLPRPAQSYSVQDQSSLRLALEKALAVCPVKGQAIDKLVLQSPDGNLWQVTVDNAGTLATVAL